MNDSVFTDALRALRFEHSKSQSQAQAQAQAPTQRDARISRAADV